MQIREVFDRKRFVFLDGGMGTQLQARGLQPGQKPELAALEMPEVLTAIHTDYANAGADILLANTFGANAKKLTGCGHTVEEVVSASITCARKAAETTGACVALDIGPLGELLVPAGTLAFEDAYNEFAQVIRAGAAAGADLVFLETMTDLYELKAALLAVKENSSLPVIVTMTYEERGRTFLALRGQVSCVETGKKPYVVGSTGDKAELFSQIDRDGWNECHVIARGHTLIHLINGHVMSVVVDDDPQERTSEGLIGMQVHVGPPMKIEFRNIRLKTDRKEVSGR